PLADATDEFACVVSRVGMGKGVAEVQPDLPVVRIAHQRIHIRHAPRAYVTQLQFQEHKQLSLAPVPDLPDLPDPLLFQWRRGPTACTPPPPHGRRRPWASQTT